jgi:chromate reductase, NAD(P)H dehydrogenase (quinone)
LLFVKLNELRTFQSPSFEQKGIARPASVDKKMDKVVVISGTNRPGSYTLRVCKAYMSLLEGLGIEAMLLDFRELKPDLLFATSYGESNPELEVLIDRFIRSNKHFIFVSPEYNGSFPGLLKLFLDTVPPREWTGKNACLVGVSQGRAGNLRGMEHLTGILHYSKMHVHYNKLPISLVDKMVSEQGEFTSEVQAKVCLAQLRDFLNLR